MYSEDGSPGSRQDYSAKDTGVKESGAKDTGFQAYDAKVRRLHGDRGGFDDFHRPRRRRGIRAVPLRIIVPNLITLLALCMGLTAIRFAIEGQFEIAVVAVIVAAILDGLDGRIARVLRGTTRFGAELDSLADFVDFGVAPALILYFWGLHEMKSFGWFAALVFAIAAALRLARFNVMIDDPNRPSWQAHFFTGMPAPAGAIVGLLPLYLNLSILGSQCAGVGPFRNRLCVDRGALDGEPHPAFFGQKDRPGAPRICDRRPFRVRHLHSSACDLSDGDVNRFVLHLSGDHPLRHPPLQRLCGGGRREAGGRGRNPSAAHFASANMTGRIQPALWLPPRTPCPDDECTSIKASRS